MVDKLVFVAFSEGQSEEAQISTIHRLDRNITQKVILFITVFGNLRRILNDLDGDDRARQKISTCYSHKPWTFLQGVLIRRRSVP